MPAAHSTAISSATRYPPARRSRLQRGSAAPRRAPAAAAVVVASPPPPTLLVLRYHQLRDISLHGDHASSAAPPPAAAAVVAWLPVSAGSGRELPIPERRSAPRSEGGGEVAAPGAPPIISVSSSKCDVGGHGSRGGGLPVGPFSSQAGRNANFPNSQISPNQDMTKPVFRKHFHSR